MKIDSQAVVDNTGCLLSVCGGEPQATDWLTTEVTRPRAKHWMEPQELRSRGSGA